MNELIEPIKIAIIAVGGDGGGVLTQWIVKLAEKNGFWAQSTTIAGVAQRTGSTVYYIELFPLDSIAKDKIPILAQMPAPEEVDIVMTTEIMEAGRAIQRGFVNKNTTLIFSTHRNLAIKEKENPGDGILNGEKVFELATKYAKKVFAENLKELAEKNHSVISASLFGALAASETLPFDKEKFEETIKNGGVAVATSLKTFNATFELIKSKNETSNYKSSIAAPDFTAMPEQSDWKALNDIILEIKEHFPKELHGLLYHSVLHLSDWQNLKWSKVYLEKLKPWLALDPNLLIFKNIARYLATGMSYDDLINVADIKTRKNRWQVVFKQVDAKENDIVKTVEYLHPGFEELSGFMPKALGKIISKNTFARNIFDKYFNKGRRLKSHRLSSFLMLYFLGGMKNYRFKTLRHHEEMQNIDLWLERIKRTIDSNYALALEISRTYRLKKGYGDTYARGHSKFRLLNDFAMENQNKAGVETKMDQLIDFALNNHSLADLEEQIINVSF